MREKQQRGKSRMVEKQYTVQEGDSLYRIGRELGTVPEGIYILNHLKSDRLEIGQKLWIPSYVEAQVLYEDTPVYRWESSEGEILGRLDAGCRSGSCRDDAGFSGCTVSAGKRVSPEAGRAADRLWGADAGHRSPGILYGRREEDFLLQRRLLKRGAMC